MSFLNRLGLAFMLTIIGLMFLVPIESLGDKITIALSLVLGYALLCWPFEDKAPAPKPAPPIDPNPALLETIERAIEIVGHKIKGDVSDWATLDRLLTELENAAEAAKGIKHP